YEIAIANREAGDEGEIDRVAERPALKKANQHAQGNLKRQYHRQDRPREMDGAAGSHEEASPHYFCCVPVHAGAMLSIRLAEQLREACHVDGVKARLILRQHLGLQGTASLSRE